MTVYISDCGGVIGPPLVRWLLEHSTAAIVGTNTDHENMGHLLAASRFRFYVVADRDDSKLLRRVTEHPDVVVVLSAVERPGDDSVHIRNRAELVQTCAEIGARLVYVTSDWGDGVEDIPADAPLSVVIRAEAERETRQLIQSYGTADLSYVVLQVFDVLDNQLEARPVRHSPPLLETVKRAIRERNAPEIPLDPEDLVPRTFTSVDEVAEGVGLAILADGEMLSGRVLDIAHPDNSASLVDVAGMALDRVAQHRPGDPLPVLQPPPDRGSPPPARRPDSALAQSLLDWRPRRSLRDIVDAAVRRIIEETRGR